MVNLAFFRGKRILITGHTGFKGSWLARILLNAGASVAGYALKPAAGPGLFRILKLGEKIESKYCDIADLDALSAFFKKAKPEIVFHMAAQPIVREGYNRPAYTYMTNVMGTVNLLECARLFPGVRSFVNVTTDKVYENKEQKAGYVEADNLCGHDPYANSKSCSELVTYSYKKSFFSTDAAPAVSTARSGNVIGGGDFAKDRIIPDCVRAALAKKPVIVRNAHSIRPYQHVLECLSGYLLLAQKQYEDKKFSGNYNFGPDDADCVTTGDIAEIFCRKWGNGMSWTDRHDKGPHETTFLKLNSSRAKKALGWRTRWGIEESIEKTVEWTKAWASGKGAAGCLDSQIGEYFGSK
jgi:CDP-glucose 4,6-dehydratase